jgi:hypothetical protein
LIDDVEAWHAASPDDWTVAWQRVQDKWGETDRCPAGEGQAFNIDAKLNAAYVLIGLLYGEGDFERSMRIAQRCGQDSDCNTSTVGGILGNWIGLSRIPEPFQRTLSHTDTFSYTNLTLDDCLQISEELARQVVELSGGTRSGSGSEESWRVPSLPIEPLILEQWPMSENTPPALQASVRQRDGSRVELEADAEDPDGIGGIQWFFGDLTYGSGMAVAHTFPGSGSYPVVVYASDGIGNTAWTRIEVQVP